MIKEYTKQVMHSTIVHCLLLTNTLSWHTPQANYP